MTKPTVSNVSHVFNMPVREISPNDGLKPQTPQKLAGLIIDAADCVPNENGTSPFEHRLLIRRGCSWCSFYIMRIKCFI